MEAHRLPAPGSFEVVADALFGQLTASEAAAVRHTLAALSEAAGRLVPVSPQQLRRAFRTAPCMRHNWFRNL